jgi:glycosyltransferase involved in cell wall biosynthesis
VTADASPVAWSVVVPTFNRPARLADCVTALAALHPPAGGFEIVIVNDGGVEPSAAIRRAATAGNASGALFLTQHNSGPAVARNVGAERARGRWLAFTDDDCAPGSDWLLVLEEALAATPDALVGGPVVNALSANLLSEASQRLAEFVKAYFDGAHRAERFFTSNNIALARTAFFEAGGFDARFGRGTGEDREFCDRWQAQGRPSLVRPRAVVRHSHDLTVTSFLSQHCGYGRGARHFRAVRRDAGRPVRIDPAFYIASLRHAWQGTSRPRGAALAVMTAAAHAAYLVGLADASVRGARRESDAASAPADDRVPRHR